MTTSTGRGYGRGIGRGRGRDKRDQGQNNRPTMILRSIVRGDDIAKTPTKLNTGRVGLKTTNVTSGDAPVNAALGSRRLSLEDCSTGGFLSTPITISDSIQTDETSDANSIITEFLSNVNANNSKNHTAKLRTEGISDQSTGLEPNTITPT